VLCSRAAFAEEPIKVKGTVTKIDEEQRVTIQPKEGEAVTVVMKMATCFR
jgi:hypothetical protein